MNEGGQSSTGQLIDFMVTTHPAYPKLLKLAEETKKSWFDILAERLEGMRVEKGVPTASELVHSLGLYLGRWGFGQGRAGMRGRRGMRASHRGKVQDGRSACGLEKGARTCRSVRLP